jgi:FtsZ-interacting cell division protein ZipA
MEFIILIVAIVAVLTWFMWKDRKFDDSGSHPLDGATKNAVVEALDVNKDGKVDIKDAVAAAEVVVEKTKKTATKAKTVAKKTVAKAKTAVKKPAAKKPKAK